MNKDIQMFTCKKCGKLAYIGERSFVYGKSYCKKCYDKHTLKQLKKDFKEIGA